jgi:tellurite resistance-related uncharacterized protein
MTQAGQMLPANVRRYKQSAVFYETTMPAGLRRRHCTKLGVWGLIQVIEGQLRYRVLDSGTESILDPGHPGVAQPEQMHEVEPLGRVRFYIEFHSVKNASTDGGPDQLEGDGPHG